MSWKILCHVNRPQMFVIDVVCSQCEMENSLD